MKHSHPELDGEYVVYVDEWRSYVAVSDGVCKLLGYTREQLLGKKIEDITPPEARSEVAREFHQYLHYSASVGEYILLAADGRRIPIRYKSIVFDDGCMGASWELCRAWKTTGKPIRLFFRTGAKPAKPRLHCSPVAEPND
jgi:PAS domain S-box-containing protein